MDPAGIPALQDAIRHLEGCESTHFDTAPVEERTPDGREVVWKGDVEVFTLLNHPKQVYRAYAWSEATTGNKRRFFVVLHSAEIDLPTRRCGRRSSRMRKRQPGTRATDETHG